jgi:hypothetical protein
LISTRGKAKLVKQGATTAVKHPKATRRAGRVAMKAAKPVARRRVRREVEHNRTLLRVLVGVIVAAGALYLLELGAGAQQRRKLAQPTGSAD